MERQGTGFVDDILAQVVVQSILVSLEDGQLHTFVGPQAVEGREKFVRQWLLDANIRRCVDELRVSLCS